MNVRETALYPFAKRFFAGETLDDAVARARSDNLREIGATVDYLGEDVSSRAEALAALSEYVRAVDAVATAGLDASVSIKLTHIGLDIDRDLAENSAVEIARHAKQRGVFVWVDMEGSAHTEETLDIYLVMLKAGAKAGVAVQAYLRRGMAELVKVAGHGGTVRIVKGAYNEPEEIAFRDMRDIRANFLDMAGYLLSKGIRFAVGTHDRQLIDRLYLLSGGGRGIEFQMLMGLRDDLKLRLVSGGARVVEYVPYGRDWYGYGMRRIREKRRNMFYFAQGIFGR